MRDLDKALADIFAIRSQIAAGTAFRGYGPAAIATTAGLALLTTIAQSIWLDDPNSQLLAFFAGWIVTALVSALLIGLEMRARSRRHHSGLADEMIRQAVEQFVPAGVAGALLAVTLWMFAPATLWMLPGLWQILVSLGIFASVRMLPRSVGLVGAWYFVAGFSVLAFTSDSQSVSPLTMGLPFVIGQLLMAFVLRFASGDDDVEA